MSESSPASEHKSKAFQLLKSLLYTLPLAVLGEWQLFEKEKTFPQWWAAKGLPSLLKVGIIWILAASLLSFLYYCFERIQANRKNQKRVKAYRPAYDALTLDEKVLLRDSLLPFGRSPGLLSPTQMSALNRVSQKTAFISLNEWIYELNPNVKEPLEILLSTDKELKRVPTELYKELAQLSVSSPSSKQIDPVFKSENKQGDTKFISYGISWTTKHLFRDAPALDKLRESPDNITITLAALARFYFEPDTQVDPTLYLSAHIKLFNEKNEFLTSVIDGVWEGPELKRSAHIKQGRALELIIGLIPLDGSHDKVVKNLLYTVEAKHSETEPDLELFSGSEFFVTVELLPKTIKQRTFPLQPFRYQLSLQPEPQLIRIE